MTLVFSFSQSFASKTYYGNYFSKFGVLPSNDLKNLLSFIVSHPHIKQANGDPDIILETPYCPSEVAQCYRHTLLTQDGNTYTEAKKVLYNEIEPHFLENNKCMIDPIYAIKPLVFTCPANGNFKQIVSNAKHNAEHVWPRSRFDNPENSGEYRYQISDLHHLYPSLSLTNSLRSSFLFSENIPVSHDREIDQEILDRWNDQLHGSQLGDTILPNGDHTQVYFMPIESSRGRVARAILYFSVRYKISINDTSEFFIRKWHREYPVSQAEVIRNERVFKAQGNRNPFVDYPKLENHIQNF